MATHSTQPPEPDEVVGPIYLPLKSGNGHRRFELWYFTFGKQRWVVACLGTWSATVDVPLRIESACLFGHVLRSAQCDCGEQFHRGLDEIGRRGLGIAIYGIDQDARGLGIRDHFEIYRLRQQEALDTPELYARLGKPVDARDYTPVAHILRRLEVQRVLLLSNNPKRRAFLNEWGFDVSTEALEVDLDPYNISTLMLEKEDLGYEWSFKTHGDWLKPIQQQVDGRPAMRAIRVVRDNKDVVFDQCVDENRLLDTIARARDTGDQVDKRVAYLSDLPRIDEIDGLATLGCEMVVVPYAKPHEPLISYASAWGLRLQDWGREHNPYEHPRPQWEYTARIGVFRVYALGQLLRLVAVSSSDYARSLCKRLREAYQGLGYDISSINSVVPVLELPMIDQVQADAHHSAGWGLLPVGSTRAQVLAIGPDGQTLIGPAALPRAVGEAFTGLRVDTADAAPSDMASFRPMNPFNVFDNACVPVPGTDKLARSIESVWQGLKLVHGKTAFEMFDQTPTKRPGDDERASPRYDYAASRFVFSGREVGLVEARLLIYLPAYLHVLVHCVPRNVLNRLLSSVVEFKPVAVYDWDSNIDLTDTRSSFSHSALIASWCQGTLTQEYLPLARRAAQAHPLFVDSFSAFEDLIEQAGELRGELMEQG